MIAPAELDTSLTAMRKGSGRTGRVPRPTESDLYPTLGGLGAEFLRRMGYLPVEATGEDVTPPAERRFCDD